MLLVLIWIVMDISSVGMDISIERLLEEEQHNFFSSLQISFSYLGAKENVFCGLILPIGSLLQI